MPKIIEPKDLPVISSLELVNRLNQINRLIKNKWVTPDILKENILQLTKLPRAFNLD